MGRKEILHEHWCPFGKGHKFPHVDPECSERSARFLCLFHRWQIRDMKLAELIVFAGSPEEALKWRTLSVS